MADFASRLRDLRKEKGLRQVDLAKDLGLAQTTIANYEQNARFPDERTLKELAGYFDVSLDYLLGRTEARPIAGAAALGAFRGNGPTALGPLAHDYLRLMIDGKKYRAFELIVRAATDGTPIGEIHAKVFEPVLREIGRLWETNEIDISREHYVSEATEALMARLYPFLKIPRAKKGTVVLAAVGGELHRIGLKMVADSLEEAGYDACYLGVNTPTMNVHNAVVERNADVLAITATLFMSADSVANTIAAVRSAERAAGRAPVLIMVGGQAFNADPGLWKRVGADGWAASASEAVKTVEWLIRERRAS